MVPTSLRLSHPLWGRNHGKKDPRRTPVRHAILPELNSVAPQGNRHFSALNVFPSSFDANRK